MRLGRVAVLPLLVGLVGLVAACADESDAVVTRSFVELGTSSAVAQLESPVWTDTDEVEALQDVLEDAATAGELDEEILDDALAALEPPPDGHRGAAFVLPGCADTGAARTIEGSVVSAELTGGENINCDTAVYFLAVFDIPTDDLPEDARLD